MSGRATRLGRAFHRWGWGVLVAASLGVLELDNASLGLRAPWLVAAVLLAGALALAPLLRGRSTESAVVCAIGAAYGLLAVWQATGVAGKVNVTPIYVIVAIPYVSARCLPSGRALASLAVVITWVVALSILSGPTPAASYISIIGVPSAAWALGRWIRARSVQRVELKLRMQRIEAERDSRIRLAVADERTRIARDLQALIAGSVSAMVLQAEAAELLLGTDLGAADRAMLAVERTGRSALTDMRRMLGGLREAEAAPLLAPQPGVGQVYALIETARGGGKSIEFSAHGDPGPLPASVDLALFRILEEALDSDSRAKIAVDVVFTDDEVGLRIAAAGSGLPAWPTLAMRERAAICGGAVEAKTLPESGELRVSLPRRREQAMT
jgi:signal transduction histidine kinase